GAEVPVSALLPSPRSPGSRRWHGGFAREVMTVARDEGLVRPQLAPGPRRLLLLLAAVVPAGLPLLFVWRSGARGAVAEVLAALLAARVLLAAWALLPRGGRVTRAPRGTPP